MLVKSQCNAVGEPLYNDCMEYLNNRDYSNEQYERIIEATVPIYLGCEADFTGGAHYVFNVNTSDGRWMLEQLQKQPNRYVACGLFEGLDNDKFRLYRCLW